MAFRMANLAVAIPTPAGSSQQDPHAPLPAWLFRIRETSVSQMQTTGGFCDMYIKCFLLLSFPVSDFLGILENSKTERVLGNPLN
jgi:hypothetical protein